jgi:type II secretory pathway pseudopilin PulG
MNPLRYRLSRVSSPKRRRAFTLIELLASVVAIIATICRTTLP